MQGPTAAAPDVRRAAPRGGRAVALLALAWAVAGGAAPARAEDAAPGNRAVIDQITVEPSALAGLARLRVYVSALTLDGQVLDLTDPKAVKLVVGGAELKAPMAVGRFAAAGGEAAVVVAIQADQAFAGALPMIVDTLDRALLAALPDAYQVGVVTFGEGVGAAKLGTVKAARARLATLSADGAPSEPALLDTLERGLVALKRAGASAPGRPLRKVLVVIADGRDRLAERDRIVALGRRAAREGVRIAALGYSPTDTRRPLLGLGELSRRSQGTFRWVRTPATTDTWETQLKHLRDELAQQYVLTYFVPAEDVVGKKARVVTSGRTSLTTADVKIPEARCGADACEAGYCAAGACVVPAPPAGRGLRGWLALLLGGGVAALGGLTAIGFVLSRRRGGPRAAPGQPDGAAAPGAALGPPGAAAPPGAQAGATGPAAPVAYGGQPGPAGLAWQPGQAAPAPVVQPAPGQPILFFLGGPRAGERVAVRHGLTIGKAPGCDLQIDDGYTSGQHAQLGMDRWGNCVVYDRGSTNGTFVNGVRVTEQPLSHGVTIKVGATELRFLTQ